MRRHIPLRVNGARRCHASLARQEASTASQRGGARGGTRERQGRAAARASGTGAAQNDRMAQSTHTLPGDSSRSASAARSLSTHKRSAFRRQPPSAGDGPRPRCSRTFCLRLSLRRETANSRRFPRAASSFLSRFLYAPMRSRSICSAAARQGPVSQRAAGAPARRSTEACGEGRGEKVFLSPVLRSRSTRERTTAAARFRRPLAAAASSAGQGARAAPYRGGLWRPRAAGCVWAEVETALANERRRRRRARG